MDRFLSVLCSFCLFPRPDQMAHDLITSHMRMLRSLLQDYGIGYGWWAVTHLLCFAGAFFAILAAEAWGQMGRFTSEHGHAYWVVNAARLLALFVGGMGFPALLIFPLFLYKRWVMALAAGSVYGVV